MKDLLIFGIILSLASVGCTKKEEKSIISPQEIKQSVRARITAASGVVLREKPSRNSLKIDSIRHYSEIDVLDDSGPVEIIGDSAAPWIRVKYEGKEGWIFGAFAEKITSGSVMPFVKNAEYFAQAGYNLPLKWNMSRESIVKSLGEPERIQDGTFQSPRTRESYPLHILEYNGYSIEIVKSPTRSFIRQLEMTKSSKPLLFKLKIGDSVERFTKILGEPESVSDGKDERVNGKAVKIHAYPGKEGANSVDLYSSAGLVVKIIWKAKQD